MIKYEIVAYNGTYQIVEHYKDKEFSFANLGIVNVDKRRIVWIPKYYYIGANLTATREKYSKFNSATDAEFCLKQHLDYHTRKVVKVIEVE